MLQEVIPLNSQRLKKSRAGRLWRAVMGDAKVAAGRVGNRLYILVDGTDAATGWTLGLQLNFGPELLPPPPPRSFFNATVDFELLNASKHYDMQIRSHKTM